MGKKWEYKVEESYGNHYSDQSMLNQLGAEGWECISIRHISICHHEQRAIFYLKRLQP